jgi:hypothetical protein
VRTCWEHRNKGYTETCWKCKKLNETTAPKTQVMRVRPKIKTRNGKKAQSLVQLTCRPSFVWRLLHRLAWEVEDWSTIQERYKSWKKLIPSYGCTCSSKWEALQKKHPPPFDDRDEFFRWTVDRHNDVNDRLRQEQGGHPNISVEDACAIYRPINQQKAEALAVSLLEFSEPQE